MPAWSAAARDLRNMQWLLQRNAQHRDRPGVEGDHGELKPPLRQIISRVWKNPRFDRIRGNRLARPANQGKQPN
jgi:hypothetical protein